MQQSLVRWMQWGSLINSCISTCCPCLLLISFDIMLRHGIAKSVFSLYLVDATVQIFKAGRHKVLGCAFR